jgi:SAM-dependent methyltransferase
MKIVNDYGRELELVGTYIKAQAKPSQVLQILEAGCGREWYFDLSDIPHELTGADTDADALRSRVEIQKDLTRGILGDLRTLELAPDSFDVIYSSFVLEHIAGAETVLKNFVRWLKPGGILIVRVPDLGSVQGFVAGRLPHRFHVLYYRYGRGLKNAGMPGFAPYPTVYDKVISAPGLRNFCAAHGLKILDELGVGSYADRGQGIFKHAIFLFARLMHIATFGKVHDRYVDLTLVACKQ